MSCLFCLFQMELQKENFYLEPIKRREIKASSSFDKHYPRYEQKVNYLGNKLQFYSEKIHMTDIEYVGTFFHMGRAVFIPIDKNLRQQLNILEEFVKANVEIPEDLSSFSEDENVYKPLYSGPQMHIQLSKFCKFYRNNRKIPYEDKQDLPTFGKGTYQFQIEVPHIYIGPHQNGKLVSISLCVTGINFCPDYAPRPLLQRQNANLPSE